MNTKTAIVLASLAAAAGAPAWGDIFIDDFENPATGASKVVIIGPAPGFGLPVGSGNPNPSPLYDGPEAGILGDFRALSMSLTAPPPPPAFPADNTAELGVESGFLNYASSPTMDAIARVTWDASSAGLGPVDLLALGGTAFRVDVTSADQAGSTARMGIGEGVIGFTTDYWSPPFPIPTGPSGILFAFADFAGGSDFSAVDAIYLEIDGVPAANILFSGVVLVGAGVPVIPEASPIVALGALAGILGVWHYRRSRRLDQ